MPSITCADCDWFSRDADAEEQWEQHDCPGA